MSNPLLVRCRISSLTFIVPQIWLLRILQRSKYTISGRRGFCNARNTLFLAAADFAALEIHYFWSSQILQRPKYTISGRRRFATAQNTQRRAVADLQQPVAVFDGSPTQDNAQLATVPLSVGISYPTWDRRPGGWRTAVRDRCR